MNRYKHLIANMTTFLHWHLIFLKLQLKKFLSWIIWIVILDTLLRFHAPFVPSNLLNIPKNSLFYFSLLLLSMPPSSSAVSVVSQTHGSYGPWGTLGLCYILPYKQPNRHPQHARIFSLLCSPSYVYFYSLKQNRFLGSTTTKARISEFLWE